MSNSEKGGQRAGWFARIRGAAKRPVAYARGLRAGADQISFRPTSGRPKNALRDLFEELAGKLAGGASSADLTPADVTCAICITPRSGSTWLRGVLEQTRQFGYPREYLNVNVVRNIARELGDTHPFTSIDQYMDVIRHCKRTDNGVFAIKFSFWQLYSALALSRDLGLIVPANSKFVYLTRDDFILQGISLYKATETGFFHSTQRSASGAKHVGYDERKIEHWTNHILQQEYRWEGFFLEHAITPLRLLYEENVARPMEVLQLFASLLELTEFRRVQMPEAAHQKMGNDENQEWRERFVEANSPYVDYWRINRGKESVKQGQKELGRR
jgi:LPS sulfotransferase NodH